MEFCQLCPWVSLAGLSHNMGRELVTEYREKVEKETWKKKRKESTKYWIVERGAPDDCCLNVKDKGHSSLFLLRSPEVPENLPLISPFSAWAQFGLMNVQLESNESMQFILRHHTTAIGWMFWLSLMVLLCWLTSTLSFLVNSNRLS